MRLNIRIVSLVCCFFGFQFINAQEQVKLADVLVQLEAKFNVKFSYSTVEVDSVYVVPPLENDILQNIIDKLNNDTVLNFKFLNERYITVSTIKESIRICGTLIPNNENTSLLGASVAIQNSTKGVIANENGYFNLDGVDRNATVVISFLGYKTLVFSAKELQYISGNCNTIVLYEESEMLNTVLISKFLTTGLQTTTDGSTILNTKTFGVLPGLTEPDILQSIQALPGVESSNESIANINVRGGTNDQNLILWDGIKMYHSGHFFGLISAYNPYITNKVIVTKNGTSSAFSDGVSSTIRMMTKNDIGNEISGGFGANLLHADAFIELPINKKLAFHASGRRSFTDVFNSPTYENYFKRSFQDSEIEINSNSIDESNTSSNFSFYDYTAKLLFNLNDDHNFRFTAIGINNTLNYAESIISSENTTTTKASSLKQENLGFGSHWNAIWSKRFSTGINGFYSKYNVYAADYRVETDQELLQNNEVLETGVKFKANLKINTFTTILGGYQFSEIGILNTTAVSAPAYDRTKKDVLLNHALFGEVEFKKKRTYLKLGGRANYFQKFDKLILEPRLNMRQKLSNQFALKLQGEFKNQSTTQIIDFQDDFLGVEKRRWILANEQNIPIAISKQASFGFVYNHNNLLLDVEGFYKRVNGITVSNQGFYNNFQYLNASGSYDARGIEFLINKMADTYSTWLSYTYSYNDYEFKALNPSKFPNNVDVRHSVSMALNYNIFKNLELSLGGMWRTGQPFTKPVPGNETIRNGNTIVVNYDTPNRENLKDFMRLDASLHYRFNINANITSSLRMGAINVLNRGNIINTYYEVHPSDTNKTIKIQNKSLGFTPNLSFRCNF